MGRYYDRQGEPLELLEWAKLFEDGDYQRVALDEPAPGVRVSTVWLGIDHQWGGGPPLIFETMTFGTGDQKQRRYSTEREARLGHAEVLAEVREAKN